MDLKERNIPAQKHGRHPWETARAKVISILFEKHFSATLAIGDHVADVGCGDAWLVEELAKQWPQLTFSAIDIAFTAEDLLALRQRAADKAYQLSYFKNLSEAAKVQTATPPKAVLLLDVIEHVEDDIGLLKKICRHAQLEKGTRFLITVPAFNMLFSQHDVFLGHYRRYTQKSLVKCCTKAGLTVDTSGYFFSSLLLPRLAQVATERLGYRHNPKGIGGWSALAWRDNLLKKILWSDFVLNARTKQWLGLQLPGLSTYAVCTLSA